MLVAKLGEWALVGLHFPSSYTNIIAILVAKLGEWAPVGLPFSSSYTNIIAILVAKLGEWDPVRLPSYLQNGHSPFRYRHRSPTGGTQKQGFVHVIISIINDVIPFTCIALLLPFVTDGVGLLLFFHFSRPVFLFKSSFRRC